MIDHGKHEEYDHAKREEYVERLVDEAALREHLTAELGPADAFDVTRHPDGHSNETLFVTWGSRDLVLRRPPPGETAETAHDVLREHRVIDALQETDVPLPETVLACDDHDVLGCDFYVVEFLDGDVLRDEEPTRFSVPTHRRAVGEQLVDTLARIHAVDNEAVGLGEFGRPEGFTGRQVERWTAQLEWAADRTAEVREVPALFEVGDWLADNLPVTHPHTLVHGDYKLDNVLFGPGTPPEIVGVLDWELSALGDPRTDLGWMLFFWRDETTPDPPLPELQAAFMARDGYPSRRELIDRYEDRTGIAFEHGRFYLALAVYKMAVLGEMFLRRYLDGDSDDPLYPVMRTRVPTLADHATRIVEEGEPV